MTLSKWQEMQEAERRAQEEAERIERLTLEEVEGELRDQVESVNLEAFKARRERERNRLSTYMDSRYYFVLCFNNREQMNEVLRRFNFPEDALYVDGHEFMREVGQTLETPDLPPQRIMPFNKDYVARARNK